MSAKVGGVQTDLSFTLEAIRNMEDEYNLDIVGFIPEEKNHSGIMWESLKITIFDSDQEITTRTYKLDGEIGYKMLSLYNITKTDSTQTNFTAGTGSSFVINDTYEITITQIDDKYVSEL